MKNYKIDSRRIEKGDTYVAIKGFNNDGHKFINDAINAGATKIIGSEEIDCTVEYIKVNNPKEYVEKLLENDIPNNIKITGITGTNGKTTTALLTNQILNRNGFKSAYIGTNGIITPFSKFSLTNTTPTYIELIEILKLCEKEKILNVVMEISSIALEENRLRNIKLDTAAFTNLTQDHLDYHKTMNNYLKSKTKILNHLDGNMILNKDNVYSKFFIKNPIYFGKDSANLQLKKIKLNINYSLINFIYNNKQYETKIPLVGTYNVENYIQALLLANNYIKDINKIININDELKPPKGRFEVIDNNIIVDYAHTPDAVEKILNVANQLKTGKIITIIGCGGNRDNTKRPIMGRVATSLSDLVIFTNDNPRFEDPEQIIKDIVNMENHNYMIIYDREQAIKKAIEIKDYNDILLVLGKGHEDYQIIGNDKFHFDDSEIIKKHVKK